MSCFHGNHEDECEICEEVNAAFKSGYEAGVKAQQQGSWVDLTDDEIEEMYEEDVFFGSCKEIVREVIAKFKSKNTPPVVPNNATTVLANQMLRESAVKLLTKMRYGSLREITQAQNELEETLKVQPPVVPQCEPVAGLFLGGLDDSGEYGEWEVDPWAPNIEALQEKLVTGYKPVRLMLYTTPPSVEAAIEATKEKAAKVCDGMSSKYCKSAVAMECAAAIRSMK